MTAENKSLEIIKEDIDIHFTDEEKELIKKMSEKININDNNLVLKYGAPAQNKISQSSNKLLDNANDSNIDDMRKILGQVLNEIKEEKYEEDKGFLNSIKSLFSNKDKFENDLINNIESINKNLNVLLKELEDQEVELIRSNLMLDRLYKDNQKCYKELAMYIEAGNMKLNSINNIELPKLRESTSPSVIEEANMLQSNIVNFEKKMNDLNVSKTISLQMAAQIRMAQESANIISAKLNSIRANTIPLWKKQMAITLGVDNLRKAIELDDTISNSVSDNINYNIDKTKDNVKIIKNNLKKGKIDKDAIKNTNDILEEMIESLLKITERRK